MITVKNIEVNGWRAAIHGMRNPLNSWEKSDSCFIYEFDTGKRLSDIMIGEADLGLMKRLADAGPEHRKYLRFLTVTMDVKAPLYWWKEYDTYKVGTVANSCSTMHTIARKAFTEDDFSHEHLNIASMNELERIIDLLNQHRTVYNATKDKETWWQLIQMLPSSYNQERTVQLNYEVALAMIRQRRNHKLDEWNDFVTILEDLPYMKVLLHEDPIGLTD